MNRPDIDPCLALHRAYTRLRMQLDEELGTHHGIDFDDFALLNALAGAGAGAGVGASLGDTAAATAHSLGGVAAELGTSRSALLRRLRPLEKTGLVACHGAVTARRVALRAPGFGVLTIARETVARVCARPALAREAEALAAALHGWRKANDAYHRMGVR